MRPILRRDSSLTNTNSFETNNKKYSPWKTGTTIEDANARPQFSSLFHCVDSKYGPHEDGGLISER
jgi:hypothetical protein